VHTEIDEEAVRKSCGEVRWLIYIESLMMVLLEEHAEG
jgi:hypothetical protein